MDHPPEMPSQSLPPQPPAGLPAMGDSDQDVEHIRMLSICYYIQAGLTALFACVPIIHLVMGAAMLSGGLSSPGMPKQDQEMMQVMGGMFVGIATLVILSGWAMAVMNYIVARRIVRRESRILCLIIAGINCLSMPLGTVLGIFTFIVLGRPQVKESFERGA